MKNKHKPIPPCGDWETGREICYQFDHVLQTHFAADHLRTARLAVCMAISAMRSQYRAIQQVELESIMCHTETKLGEDFIKMADEISLQRTIE